MKTLSVKHPLHDISLILEKVTAQTLKLMKAVGTWMKRVNERNMLSQLSDSQLKDIGLTRSDVFQEIRKPFWKA